MAHLRGGGEYGEDWHRQGILDRKQNVFDDFLAAGDFLVQEGAARGRLAIMGGSNGGLLVGAALTQRPGLFRAVVCQVPLPDMVAITSSGSRASGSRSTAPRTARGLPVALRVFAVPPCPRRHALSGRPPHHRRVRQPRGSLHARKIGGAGCRRRPRPPIRSSCASRRVPATQGKAPSKTSRSGPTSGRSVVFAELWTSRPRSGAERPAAERPALH